MFQRLTTACFLSGANIFLTSSGLIKLGDFGCSVKLKNNAQTMPGEVNSTLGTAGGARLALSLHLGTEPPASPAARTGWEGRACDHTGTMSTPVSLENQLPLKSKE